MKSKCLNLLNLSSDPRKLGTCVCSTLVWVTSRWRMAERLLIALTTWFIRDEVFAAGYSCSSSRLNTFCCGGNSGEVSRSGGASVLSGAKAGFKVPVTMSDRLVPQVDELVALEEAVSWWRLCAWASRNSFNNWQRWASCYMSGSATALFWRSRCSEVTALLGHVSISGSHFRLGVCAGKPWSQCYYRFLRSQLLQTFSYIRRKNSCNTVKECQFS